MAYLWALPLSFVPAFGAAVLVYWLDRYEKEPKLLLGLVFAWGAIVAVIGAVMAQVGLEGALAAISGSEEAASVAGTTLFAPLTEESLKGLAVLSVFLLLRREFDSLLDGLVYSAVVALGFAATENVLYLGSEGQESGLAAMMGLFTLRVVMGLWDHPFFTAFIGIGLAISRLSRSARVAWLAPVFGWALACFFHALHNVLAVSTETSSVFFLAMKGVDWGGWIFMAILIGMANAHERRLLTRHLGEERDGGLMTPAQYHAATSSWRRTGACLRALPSGRWRATRRFYKACGELAHKKDQLARLGEADHGPIIQQLRGELGTLTRHAEV